VLILFCCSPHVVLSGYLIGSYVEIPHAVCPSELPWVHGFEEVAVGLPTGVFQCDVVMV